MRALCCGLKENAEVVGTDEAFFEDEGERQKLADLYNENAGILDGDTVIICRSDTADSGQIVVALVDDGEVTLKRLRRRGASIALEPANPRHETRIFPADRVRVQGRLVGLLRQYQ